MLIRPVSLVVVLLLTPICQELANCHSHVLDPFLRWFDFIPGLVAEYGPFTFGVPLL